MEEKGDCDSIKPCSTGVKTNPTWVKPGLAVFTRQKLTWVSFNQGRTRVSLYRVNRALYKFGNRKGLMLYKLNLFLCV